MVNYNSGFSGVVFVSILFLFCGFFIIFFIISLSVEPVLRGQPTLSGLPVPSEWPLNTGSTVPSNMRCFWTGQSNCSWFKLNRYLREEFRSLNSAFRALLANDHSEIFPLQWIMNWTCLSIYSRGFLEADYSRPLIPELNIFGIYFRIKK